MIWGKFRKNLRGFISLIIFGLILLVSFLSDFWANDRPLFLKINDTIYFPVLETVIEKRIGGNLETDADFLDPHIQNILTQQNALVVWPLIRFSYDSINYKITSPAPTKPNSENILGTDDQGRDVLARSIYAIRISLIFGIILSLFSVLIGVFLGAIQGFFGGLTDLVLQRFIEIWSSLPVMFLLIIFSALIEPSFLMLLFLLLLFSWMSLVSFVRAEFLRLRNFDFVKASKCLGASNYRIMLRHILPNASPVIIANLPFLVAGAITTLTSLDFLGLGLPIGSPSLGELLAQGKNNLNAYWLGITGFMIVTTILTLLVFIGEALRDALDVRKG